MQRRNHRRLVNRSTLGLLAGGLALLTLSGCDSLGPAVHESRTMSIPHLAGSALSVTTANGSVLVERQQRADVQLDIDIFGPDSERLSFASVNAVRQADGSLRVWVDWPGGKRQNNEGANIDVLLPDAIGVDVRTSNGRVTLKGLAGHAEVATSNGSVTIERHSGSATVQSSNGKLVLDRVDGEIKGDTSNGAVMITEAFGPVEAESSNGNVFVSTAHGNPGPVRVSTSNGRVELALGDGFEGILRVKTSNGSISMHDLGSARLIESGKHTLELQIGESETISAVRTSNGSVRVKSRGQD
ncbi:MAG: DUF4097 family beta strand repeat protein [Phycisphaerales bacterium]|nr:DUF4097 family beta strand repeat protein [Phycisphaerales bacterium]